MIHQECFLKPNVMAEPLVDDWYAWARLIPTTTLARNLAERHLRIMDSYIQSPETHQAAVKDPRLLGGPFMDLDGNRLDFEETRFDRGSITAILFLGEHGDLNVLTQSAYLVRIGTHSLVFAPDSCSISPKLYEHVHRETGDIDALFLGMECDGAPFRGSMVLSSHSECSTPRTIAGGSQDQTTTGHWRWLRSSDAKRCSSMRWV